MDPIQEQFEQGVGDRFAQWLTAETGEPCVFCRRADRAPDLVYSYKGCDLLVEITAAYYDQNHAQFLWKGVRNALDAPAGWVSGINSDKSLATAIAECVEKKSKKRYGENTVLLIEVPPGTTSVERLTELLLTTLINDTQVFSGIFVTGNFPICSGSGRTQASTGGYRVIAIKPLAANASQE